MKDFTRGLVAGLLVGIGASFLMASYATDLPADLVAVAKNNAGGTMFFTVYSQTKDGVPHGVKCNTNWHVVMSVTPADKVFGCYAFDTSARIQIAWADGDLIVYKASLLTLADWFIKAYPDLAPAPPTGKITRTPHDTIL